MKKILLSLTILLSIAFGSFATHIAGGFTQIVKTSPTEYAVSVFIIRDCSGIFAPQTVPVNITDSCNFSATAALSQKSSFFTSPFCGSTGASTCSGGNLPGFEIVEYVDTITIASNCGKIYAFADLGCCRPITNNLLNAMNMNIVVAAMLSDNNPVGHSPLFENVTTLTPAFCVGNNDYLLVDDANPNLDSKYEFVNPLGAIGTTIPFASNYSLSNPMNNASIDANTGIISVNPSSLGTYSLPIKTTQFQSNPSFTSYALFELRALTYNCMGNSQPSIAFGNVGNATINGDTIELCGPNTCIDLDIFSNSMLSSFQIVGANFNYSLAPSGNPQTLTFCPAISSGYQKYFLSVEDSCMGQKITKTFVVGGNYNNGISGSLNSSSGAVTNTLVLMVGIDTANATVYAIDSTYSDNAGNFQFNSISDSLVLFKCIPDSTAYPNLLPTYLDSSITAISATQIPQYCHPTQVNINVQSGNNPGGVGFIAGNIYQGAGKNGPGDPVESLPIYLLDMQNNVVSFKNTNDNGYFKFNGLNAESYKIFVDNGTVTNANAPVIDLSNTNQITLNFNLFKDSLAIDQTTNTKNYSVIENKIEIYPNPIQNDLWIVLPKHEPANLVIYDVVGKSVFQKNLPNSSVKTRIDLNQIPSGLYFISINGESQNFTSRFVKR